MDAGPGESDRVGGVGVEAFTQVCGECGSEHERKNEAVVTRDLEDDDHRRERSSRNSCERRRHADHCKGARIDLGEGPDGINECGETGPDRTADEERGHESADGSAARAGQRRCHDLEHGHDEQRPPDELRIGRGCEKF